MDFLNDIIAWLGTFLGEVLGEKEASDIVKGLEAIVAWISSIELPKAEG